MWTHIYVHVQKRSLCEHAARNNASRKCLRNARACWRTARLFCSCALRQRMHGN